MRRTLATALRMEKTTARVFCPLTNPAGNLQGGNPVTIFQASTPLSPTQCRQLAQTCAWESVFVFAEERKIAFYAPSGERMRFCAHAAMGGAYAAGFSDFVVDQEEKKEDPSLPEEHHHREQYLTSYNEETQIMSLTMKDVPWSQTPVEHVPALHRILRDYHQVHPSVDCTLPVVPVAVPPSDNKETDENGPPLYTSRHEVVPLPTCVHATLGASGVRKTLVYLNSYVALQERVRPPPTSAAAVHYPRALREQLDDTTGLYLYTSKQQRQPANAPAIAAPEDAWECRQFPRASGYAEDPATGVAAALLALGLHVCEQSLGRGTVPPMTASTTTTIYTFHQGTALGRPSVLQVRDIVMELEEEDVTVEETPVEEAEFLVTNPPDEVTTAPEDEDMRTMDTETLMDAEIVSTSEAGDDVPPPKPSPPEPPRRQTSFRGRVSFTLSGRIEVDTREVVEVSL